MSAWRLQWPPAWGGPLGSARLKAEPEDFCVDEVLGFELSGAGEHLCLYLEKRGDNTDYVARQLAKLAGCRPMDVSFCGLKDRQGGHPPVVQPVPPRGAPRPMTGN